MNLPQTDYDELRRLRNDVLLAQARYDLAVMQKYAENRVDPRAAQLIVGDTGASFVKTGTASNGAKAAPAQAAAPATAETGAPVKRGRGRPRKVVADAVAAETPTEADENSTVVASFADAEPGVVTDATPPAEKVATATE